MSFNYPKQEQSRHSRVLNHVKGFSPKIVNKKPESSEGKEGDIAMGTTPNGIKLFIKLGARWYSFSADKTEVEQSKVVNFKSTSIGTVAVPSKFLLPSDSGKTFIVDISDYTAVFKLPPVATSSGVDYTFIMSEESSGISASNKDFILITHSTSEDLMGPFHTSGSTSGLGVSRSIIQFDSSDGAIHTGDILKIICNGKAWYLHGITFANNMDAADDFTVS